MTGQQWSETIVAVASVIAFAMIILGLAGALPWQSRRDRR